MGIHLQEFYKTSYRGWALLDFFEGQFFDAYIFISDILKNAKKSITLIDNYIGASLKDLGNKWFAFSKLENDNLELLGKVNNILEGKH